MGSQQLLPSKSHGHVSSSSPCPNQPLPIPLVVHWYLDLGPSHRKYKCTLSHVDMSALLLKLQTEREKREALEHEVDIINRRLEERSVVQSAADYKQHSSLRCYMYSFTYTQVLKLLTGSTVRDVSCRTYRRFHATLTGIQAVSSQSCCAAALENK